MRVLAAALALLLLPLVGWMLGLAFAGLEIGRGALNGTEAGRVLSEQIMDPAQLWSFLAYSAAGLLAGAVVFALAGALRWVRGW